MFCGINKKFGEIITTLLISSAKIKKENYDRIICQDLKTVFKVMVDGKAQKTICSLEILKTGYVMNIDKLRISPNLEAISAKEIRCNVSLNLGKKISLLLPKIQDNRHNSPDS